MQKNITRMQEIKAPDFPGGGTPKFPGSYAHPNVEMKPTPLAGRKHVRGN